MHRKTQITLFILSIFLSAFSFPIRADSPKTVKLATTAPDFTRRPNEVEIASELVGADPTWVLGSLVNNENGTVRGLDSYLKSDARLITLPMAKEYFSSYVDNSLVAAGGWLSFLSGKVNDNTRAHVTFSTVSKVTIDNRSIDKDKLIAETNAIPEEERGNYGLIFGYIDYALKADFYSGVESEGDAGVTGISINGSYFKRSGEASESHKVIALWTPLPFAVQLIENRKRTNLDKATTTAIEANKIVVSPIVQPIVASPIVEPTR